MGRVSVIEDMPATAKGRARDDAGDVAGDGARHDAGGRGPAGEGAPPDGGLDGVLFDAVLFPNRSLPTAGFAAVMTVVIAANLTFGVYFLALGAWPVLGFCGLDVFLVWLAFKVSYRQGRLRERIVVTREALKVARVMPSGHEMRWELQPYWTRVEIDEPVRHESQVAIRSKGRTLVVGAFLSPMERADLARALKRALVRSASVAAEA
ncbi:MAG: DUF2244 domain-containing protein [Pseudomonadota bacterium]